MLSTSALCRFIHKDVKKNTHALSDHYPNYIRPKVKTSNKQEYVAPTMFRATTILFHQYKNIPEASRLLLRGNSRSFCFCGKHLR